jgi:hypothetical protein
MVNRKSLPTMLLGLSILNISVIRKYLKNGLSVKLEGERDPQIKTLQRSLITQFSLNFHKFKL